MIRENRKKRKNRKKAINNIKKYEKLDGQSEWEEGKLEKLTGR